MTKHFLASAQSWATRDSPAKLINLTSSTAWGIWPFLAAYAISKTAIMQYTTTVAASYPDGSVLAISVNPGINETDILPPSLRNAGFDFTDPALTGAALVWLVAGGAERSRFLNGRMMTVEWDVEELVERSEEIQKGNLLTLHLNATLGVEQFGASA